MGRSHGFNWTAEKRDRVRALRASGLMYYEIAKQLSVEWGVHLTESQCSSAASLVARKERKVDQPQELVRDSFLSVTTGRPPEADRHETKPTIEVRAPSMYPWMEPPDAPVVHTSKSRAESYLIISDLQIPYHHPGALDFCKRVRFEFGVPLENMICVGDEFDMYWLSRFEKSSDAPHTANQEVEAGRVEIARWIAAFPHMMICDSNHVKGRIVGAASRAGMAAAFIRDVREVYNIPPTWRWADHWIVKASKHPFRVEHGNIGPGGHSGLRGRPLNRMISTAWGHEHAEPGAIHVNTHGGGRIWGMRTGSLLTTEPVAALSYNAEQGSRPVGSVGVVVDGGRTPIVVRM